VLLVLIDNGWDRVRSHDRALEVSDRTGNIACLLWMLTVMRAREVDLLRLFPWTIHRCRLSICSYCCSCWMLGRILRGRIRIGVILLCRY
jgi:hypothetical protein